MLSDFAKVFPVVMEWKRRVRMANCRCFHETKAVIAIVLIRQILPLQVLDFT